MGLTSLDETLLFKLFRHDSKLLRLRNLAVEKIFSFFATYTRIAVNFCCVVEG